MNSLSIVPALKISPTPQSDGHPVFSVPMCSTSPSQGSCHQQHTDPSLSMPLYLWLFLTSSTTLTPESQFPAPKALGRCKIPSHIGLTCMMGSWEQSLSVAGKIDSSPTGMSHTVSYICLHCKLPSFPSFPSEVYHSGPNNLFLNLWICTVTFLI